MNPHLKASLFIGLLTLALLSQLNSIQTKPTLLYTHQANATFGGSSTSGHDLWVASGGTGTIHSLEDGRQNGRLVGPTAPHDPPKFLNGEQTLVHGVHKTAVYNREGRTVSRTYERTRGVSPAGDRILTYSGGGNTCYLTMLEASGFELWRISVPARVVGKISFHPKGHQVAAICYGPENNRETSTVYVLDSETGKILATQESRDIPKQARFSPDGKSLGVIWSTPKATELILTDTKRFKTQRTLKVCTWIVDFRWSPNSKLVLLKLQGDTHCLQLVRVKDGSTVATLPEEDFTEQQDFTHDGKHFLTVRRCPESKSTIATLRRCKDAKMYRQLHLKGGTTVAMSPNGRVLFDSAQWEERPELKLIVGSRNHTIKTPVRGCFVDPTGTRLVTTHGTEFKVWKS